MSQIAQRRSTPAVRSAFAVLFIVVTAATARAQSTVADTLTFLMTNQSIATGSVTRDQAAAQAASNTVGRALLASLATLPVTSSTGSFTYRLNPELGTVERADRTFGPFFVERALTIGRNQASGGVSFQHLHLTSLDGRSLTDGSLITTANKFTDESAPFDVDRLRLDITADVATVYGAYGITDRLDVAGALPLVSLRIDGSRVNTYRGTDFQQAKASATTVGPADAVLRVKYLWLESRGARLASAADVRLPTGQKENLLGAGSMSAKLSALGSLDRGAWSAHANAGMSVGGFAREVDYGGAVAVAAGRRLTVSGELLGRWIEGAGTLAMTSAPHPLLAGVDTIRLSADTSWQQVVTFVPGVKWNVSSTWVLLANVVLPVTQAGLTAPATPFVGIDYAFGSIF